MFLERLFLAERAKFAGDYPNVEFVLKGKTERLRTCFSGEVDYISLKMVLHEMDEASRYGLMEEAWEVCGKFIITDWFSPQPDNIHRRITNMVEFIAGKEHYRNFRDWCRRGGIDGFLERQKLELLEERLIANGTIKIIKAGAS